jgi:hypothetical protein
VVLLAVDDQQRPARGVFRVELRLREGVEVGVRHLHQRRSGPGYVVGLVEPLRLLVVAERVRPPVVELVEREGDGAAPVERVLQHRQRHAQR